jgi:hypothetical protein
MKDVPGIVGVALVIYIVISAAGPVGAGLGRLVGRSPYATVVAMALFLLALVVLLGVGIWRSWRSWRRRTTRVVIFTPDVEPPEGRAADRGEPPAVDRPPRQLGR